MRAVVMRNKALAVADVPEPAPEAGEVLLRTLACGICGSDLHALKYADRFVEASRRAGNAFVMDLGRDVVMGHEFCAELVDYGPDTQRSLAIGTRVCSRPVLMRATGPQTIGYSNDHPGGYGEYMRLSEVLLLPVPEALPTDHAALTEPLAVGLHAVNKARLEPDDAPLVIGCGPVGLAVIAALRLADIRPIVAADFSPRRRCPAHPGVPPSSSSASVSRACSTRSWPPRLATRASWSWACAWSPTRSLRCWASARSSACSSSSATRRTSSLRPSATSRPAASRWRRWSRGRSVSTAWRGRSRSSPRRSGTPRSWWRRSKGPASIHFEGLAIASLGIRDGLRREWLSLRTPI